MTRKEILDMSNIEIDSVVRIAGTNYDRRRKISLDTVEKMCYLRYRGWSVTAIAEKFGCSYSAAKYNTEPEYKEMINKKRSEYPASISYTTPSERGKYKRQLLERGKRLPIVD